MVQGSLGVSITPSHFYFPVPSLKSFQSKDWRAPRQCPGLDLRLPAQVDRLGAEVLPYASEWNFSESRNGNHRNGNHVDFHLNNGYFERVDAEVAYSLVRHHKPRRLIEVGSGNSTLLFSAALRRNREEGHPCELTSIEPYPASYLHRVPEVTRLIQQPVQQVSLELFRTLEPNDILFIDSSHVVSLDSDVLFEILRILPEIAPGVLIHFHDVFTPLDYPEKFVKTNLCFWGEQYILEAFLSFNSAFEVLWSASAMQQFHPDILGDSFPGWQDSYSRMPQEQRIFAPTLDGTNVWPCSFWIRRAA
jgi:predicted O-methyltransferase YrrM